VDARSSTIAKALRRIILIVAKPNDGVLLRATFGIPSVKRLTFVFRAKN
jgi:hypothetical protein